MKDFEVNLEELFKEKLINHRYFNSLLNREDKILEQRAIIKQKTIAKRRQLYFQQKIINL